MKNYRKICERCKFFKTKQGSGNLGECRGNTPTVTLAGDTVFPEMKPSGWCGKFDVNLEKYHVNGKKIYTRIDTVMS